MLAGRPPLARCKVCGVEAPDRSFLSKRGKCPVCAERLVRENILGIASHSGPYFKHWRQQMALSVGGVLLDDVLRED